MSLFHDEYPLPSPKMTTTPGMYRNIAPGPAAPPDPVLTLACHTDRVVREISEQIAQLESPPRPAALTCSCPASNPADAKFCRRCGGKLVQVLPPMSWSDKLIIFAAIVAVAAVAMGISAVAKCIVVDWILR